MLGKYFLKQEDSFAVFVSSRSHLANTRMLQINSHSVLTVFKSRLKKIKHIANKEKSKQYCFCLLDNILGREGISQDD